MAFIPTSLCSSFHPKSSNLRLMATRYCWEKVRSMHHKVQHLTQPKWLMWKLYYLVGDTFWSRWKISMSPYEGSYLEFSLISILLRKILKFICIRRSHTNFQLRKPPRSKLEDILKYYGETYILGQEKGIYRWDRQHYFKYISFWCNSHGESSRQYEEETFITFIIRLIAIPADTELDSIKRCSS